nr:hypothetical protein [Actinomycetales bacterium]
MSIPRRVRLCLGEGVFRVVPLSAGLAREARPFPLRALLPLALMVAMVPFVLGGPAWRYALLALPLVGMLTLLGSSRGGRIRGRRRGHLPHEISQAAREGRAFHTEPVLPRRPRILRSGELKGTGWGVGTEEEACWLAGFLATHNDPGVLTVSSPWLTTQGDGLRVRFSPHATGGPSTEEALVTWGGRMPGWAVAVRLRGRASPAWAESLQGTASGGGVPEVVEVQETVYSTRGLARAWEKPGLAVLLGADAGGGVVVNLVGDGPHALVAGTTGAGKSELLTTWVLGLAAAAPPSHLTLVLVDFKGGAAFGPLTALPHCAAVLTDLDPGGTRRALASMRALLRQRERLLHEAGCRDIGELEALRPGSMPRLVLVVDEFRALADDHPEIMDQLLRLGAQGRSLGVHLIVATQRPAGAVGPDLRANMPLRICLRVAEVGDSHDVLGSGAAASLPRIPGRALLGPDGPREFQVAWSGDASAVLEAVGAVRAAAPAVAVEPLWLPPLPAQIPHGAFAGTVVAVADLPDELARLPVPLPPTGLLLAGPSRSGRTTAALRMVGSALEGGHEAWLVTADRQVVEGRWGGAAGLYGGALGATQVRLVGALLEHAMAGPRRTVVFDDVEIWMTAHDHLHGVGSASQLLAAACRSIAAAGSRLVVAAGPDAPTARWAANLPTVVLAGTDEASAMLAGVPRAAATSLQVGMPGRAVWLPEAREVQFVQPPAAPPRHAGAARAFVPLPGPRALPARDGAVVFGWGGDPVAPVAVCADRHLVIVGLGPEREKAEALLAPQRQGRPGGDGVAAGGAGGAPDSHVPREAPLMLAVTPQVWSTGWSGDLGRVRDSAAVLVVRPDLVGSPSGLRLGSALEPGGEGYAVLVLDGVATALRLASVVEDLRTPVLDELPRGREREQDEREHRGGDRDPRGETRQPRDGDEGEDQ